MAQGSRFEFRLRLDDKEAIEQAAALTGESASDFVRAAAVARAKEILRRQDVTIVPPGFFDTLLIELDHAHVPNERLKEAARRAADHVEIR
jgi:uncharacterized protein (DUF1778 family)